MGVPTEHLLPRPKSDAPGIVTMKGEMAGARSVQVPARSHRAIPGGRKLIK